MHDAYHFVLSDLRDGEELPRFVGWLRVLKAARAPQARLTVRLRQEDLALALIWHRQQTIDTPTWSMGPPFLETRLEEGNSLSGMLVWLAASSRRTVARGATVTMPHWMEFATPLHDRLSEAVSRHVVFTDADAELYHGSGEYRRARATMLLRRNRLLNREELRRHFSVFPEPR